MKNFWDSNIQLYVQVWEEEITCFMSGEIKSYPYYALKLFDKDFFEIDIISEDKTSVHSQAKLHEYIVALYEVNCYFVSDQGTVEKPNDNMLYFPYPFDVKY